MTSIDLVQYLTNKSDADNYSYASHVKVSWMCSKGHIFSRSIGNMTSREKFTCTVCSGKQILIGYNDLATTRPDLAAEWDYEKNTLLPTQVTAGSFTDVWWRCKNNHSWKARISARDYNNGCPYCNGLSRTSLPEQIIYFYCKKYFPDTLNMYSINGVSFDIYIPSKGIVIEYDGSAWHSSKNTDYKFKVASETGLTLYKITGVATDMHSNVYRFDDRYLRLGIRDNNLTYVLSRFMSDVFDIKEDFSDYNSAYIFARDQKRTIKNAAVTLPDNLKFEWSPLNGYGLQYVMNDGADKYWRCFYGHTFKRRIDVIRRGNINCPLCENKQSFNFFYLGRIDNLSIVLDVTTLEVEFLDDDFITKAINCGVNIQGILMHNNRLLFSKDYILHMKPTTFRINFDRFKGHSFKNIGASCYDYIVDKLTSIFSLDLSIEKIYPVLNKFLSSIG